MLQVTLPTNFKAARFDCDKHTAMLRRMQADIEAIRYDAGGDKIELPVKLKVHDSVFVPLAKWAMLLTGNYRCVTKDGPRSIKEAVHTDPRIARVYDWVRELCIKLGASPTISCRSRNTPPRRKGSCGRPRRRARCSPARRTSSASTGWCRPIAAQKGMRNAVVDETVALVDEKLTANRRAAAQ